MCYYATTDYLCGDWKWGNMMLRCPRQHRIGETCGAKLVHHESVTKSATICKVCEEINTKQRRLTKTVDNITRWSKEPDKFSASLDKARREGRELQEKIKDLHLRRPSIATNIQGAASSTTSGGRGSASSTVTTAASVNTLPPVTSITAAATPGYEYTSMPAMSRRQETGSYSIPRNGVMPVVGAANGISLGQSVHANQYASIPAGSYLNRNTSALSGGSSNMPMDLQGGAYAVSYARR